MLTTPIPKGAFAAMYQDTIYGPLAQITVMRNGAPTQFYFRQSDNLAFVQANVGEEIAIGISPHVNGRLLAVVSVDGRSVMKNEPANYLTNTGMVITGRWLCEGYEVGNGNVSKFTVTYPENSEAAWNTGSTDHVGSIGVALYQEYVPPRPRPQHNTQVFSMGDPTLETLRSAKSPVGMAGGENVYRPTGTTSFRRRTEHPGQITVIQYRPYWWLLQHGLINQNNDPNPFPNNRPTGYGHLGRR